MKLLHIGSDSIHVSSYISALQKDGLQQLLVSEIPCNFAHVEKELNVSFRKMSPGAILSNRKKLRNFIAEHKPDIVHIHQVNRLAFFAAKEAAKLNIPILTTAWGSDVLVMPQQNFVYRYLVKSVLKKSKAVTADSQEMIAAMMKIVPDAKKYECVQYGITPVQAMEKEKIIYSNRLLKAFYRVDQILRYFADFVGTNKDWKLIVGGSGVEEQHLRALCDELEITDKVEFIGFVDKETNHSIYAKATIYISIPESDGTSVSLLEAMSAGCIPVVSDLAVSKEWIRDGVNGVIENGTDNPLLTALQLDREKAASVNREIIEREATREASLATFGKLYNSIRHEGQA